MSAPEARLAAALEARGVGDVRELYRGLLRRLRSADEDAYEGAVRRYRTDLLPMLEDEATDPVEAWLRYGLEVAGRLTKGRPVAIDETGRARQVERGEPPPVGPLLLYLPEAREPAILLAAPCRPSAPQLATMELLCG